MITLDKAAVIIAFIKDSEGVFDNEISSQTSAWVKMDNNAKVLIVDDEEANRELIGILLTRLGYEVLPAQNGQEALGKLRSFPADIVITDVKMPIMDGMKLLEEIKEQHPDVFVVLVTGFATIEDAVHAIKKGAYDYLLKPFEIDSVKRLLEKITEHKRILQRNLFLQPEGRKGYRFENIIGRDPKMFDIFRRIMDVANTDTTVLITGESGTGKELVASAIHYRSHRKKGPLIKVNSAAIQETLISSELFGHEKGSFTGAVTQRKGYFEAAHGGTIFLDEIGDISIQTQVSLLRVLDSGTFQRVGGTQALEVDIRLICATNKDLNKFVKEEAFREDLYYRINVAPIHVPPLRKRKSDIPILADYFLKKHCAEKKKNISRISNKAIDLLVRYSWPGNVRELANVIENAVVFCKRKEISPGDLPKELKDDLREKGFNLDLSSRSLAMAEVTLIKKVLEETDWNLKQAAKELDVARGTLYSKMKKYGIEKTS